MMYEHIVYTDKHCVYANCSISHPPWCKETIPCLPGHTHAARRTHWVEEAKSELRVNAGTVDSESTILGIFTVGSVSLNIWAPGNWRIFLLSTSFLWNVLFCINWRSTLGFLKGFSLLWSGPWVNFGHFSLDWMVGLQGLGSPTKMKASW